VLRGQSPASLLDSYDASASEAQTKTSNSTRGRLTHYAQEQCQSGVPAMQFWTCRADIRLRAGS